jgi:hypothetical protein
VKLAIEINNTSSQLAQFATHDLIRHVRLRIFPSSQMKDILKFEIGMVSQMDWWRFVADANRFDGEWYLDFDDVDEFL